MRLKYGDNANLGYIELDRWATRVVPLLLGLYSLVPSTHKPKDNSVEWVIVEEPEMGLHRKPFSVSCCSY